MPASTQGEHGVFSAVDRGQWMIFDQLKVLGRWRDQFLIDVQIDLEMIEARMNAWRGVVFATLYFSRIMDNEFVRMPLIVIDLR